jgi:hypothetical protein
MGLVYEHWRPDTNECFYVGASREAEDSRPYVYIRDNDLYMGVIAVLKANGLVPFTKIIWDNLVYECTGTYEKLRIAYQKSLLADKLTNKALGGFGFNIDWTPEKRAEMSAKISAINNIPERLEKNRETQKVAQNRPEVIAKKSKAAKIVMNLPEVVEKNRQGQFRANATPGLLEKRGARIKEGHMKRSFEERSAVARQRQAVKTPEQKTASAKKGVETKRRMRAEKAAILLQGDE